MKLYDIHAELSELLERGFAVDEETGEVNFDVAARIGELSIMMEDKLENIALYIKNLDAEASAIKAEEQALAERRKTKEKRQEKLKKFLSDYLFNTEKDKFETARVKLSFRKSEIVDVDTKTFMPWAEKMDKFLRYSEPSVDKTELKKALKEGQEIPGAMIMTRQNLQIK